MTSPRFKVYSGAGEYRASCKSAEDAAVLVGIGYCAVEGSDGGTVRLNHGRILWREGAEEFSAAESYDGAAIVIYQRAEENRQPSR